MVRPPMSESWRPRIRQNVRSYLVAWLAPAAISLAGCAVFLPPDRADLCLYSPESYSLEEKKQICNDMMSTSSAILDAMREDFEGYPPELRARLLDALCASGCMTPEWWWDVLVGDGDPLYRELEPLA